MEIKVMEQRRGRREGRNIWEGLKGMGTRKKYGQGCYGAMVFVGVDELIDMLGYQGK